MLVNGELEEFSNTFSGYFVDEFAVVIVVVLMSEACSISAVLAEYFNSRFTKFSFSDYPSQRCTKDSEGENQGVAGTVTLLQNVTLSTQPIAGFDWNADKLGLCVTTSFDQTLRVLIVTKLKTV